MFDNETPLPYIAGSATSKAAAIATSAGAKKMARRVFDVIADAGENGMTIDELDAAFEPLGQRHQTISARVNGLAYKGLLTGGPDTRRTRKNCPAVVWRAVPEAVAKFDVLYRARVKRSPTQRAAQSFTKLTKQIAKQAIERRADLPSIGEAQRLIEDALLSLYATITR